LVRNHSYVERIPASIPIFGAQPSSVRRRVSSSFLGVPSGFEVSNRSEPSNPTTRPMVWAGSAIVSSRPHPTLT
jgi:hypothetical protein